MICCLPFTLSYSFSPLQGPPVPTLYVQNKPIDGDKFTAPETVSLTCKSTDANLYNFYRVDLNGVETKIVSDSPVSTIKINAGDFMKSMHEGTWYCEAAYKDLGTTWQAGRSNGVFLTKIPDTPILEIKDGGKCSKLLA